MSRNTFNRIYSHFLRTSNAEKVKRRARKRGTSVFREWERAGCRASLWDLGEVGPDGMYTLTL